MNVLARLHRALIAAAVTVSLVALAAGATPAAALTYSPCSTGATGFGFGFWDPYYRPSNAQVANEYAAQKQVNDLGYIIDWAMDAEASNSTWYPNSYGWPVFSDTIPQLMNNLPTASTAIWVGLVVAPNGDGNASNTASWSYLMTKLGQEERVADDLYRLYGSKIKGWYQASEPGENIMGSATIAAQYGRYLGMLNSYLHTHDGNKDTMDAPFMPSAIYTGLSPAQFAAQMQPMMAAAGPGFIWNMQDGIGMTGWTVAQEQAGFAQIAKYAASYGQHVWGDFYTPASMTPAQFQPYLDGLRPYMDIASEWTFNEYMDPNHTASNSNAAADFYAYRKGCMGY